MAPKDTQQFCVRWNSYQSNLQSAFPKLLTNEHFVDVTLACESRMVKCHKVVLSACSAYFEKLLVQNPCQHPIIFMKDMKYWEVQALVDFMYKGEVNVTQEELSSLLKAAEALEVRGLCGQHEAGMADKLALPRGTEASHEQKKRRLESEVKEISPTPNSDSNNSNPATTSMKPSPHDSVKSEHPSTPSTPSNTHVKQETTVADNGLFEDLDDDFYQERGPKRSQLFNSTPTSSRLSSRTNSTVRKPSNKPSLTSDRAGSPRSEPAQDGGNHWNLNNGYPNVILTESSNYSATPSPSNSGSGETPGKIQRIRRSDAELLSAADSICKGMTFQKASQTFNIPMSTIRFYMARKGMLPSRRRGRRISQGLDPTGGGSGSGLGGGGGGGPPTPSSVSLQPHVPAPPSTGLGYSHPPPAIPMQNPYFKQEPSGY